MARTVSALSEMQKQRIHTAVAEAERKTRAEIVPVAFAISGRYERAEDLVGLWCGLLALAGAWFTYPRELLEHGSWAARPLWLELAYLLAAVILGFVIGSFLASRIDNLRRLLTPKQQMSEEVSTRAHALFFHRRQYRAVTSACLLIYVSCFERMGSIVADGIIREKLGKKALDELCARLTESLSQDDFTEAICTLIHEAGEQLAVVLPRADEPTRELAHALIITEEPRALDD